MTSSGKRVASNRGRLLADMLPRRIRIIIVIVGGESRHRTVLFVIVAVAMSADVGSRVAAKLVLRQIGGGGRLAVGFPSGWMPMPCVVIVGRVREISRPVFLSPLAALGLPCVIAAAAASVAVAVAVAAVT